MRYATRIAAVAALKALNGKAYLGQALRVHWAFQSPHGREDTSHHFHIFIGEQKWLGRCISFEFRGPLLSARQEGVEEQRWGPLPPCGESMALPKRKSPQALQALCHGGEGPSHPHAWPAFAYKQFDNGIFAGDLGQEVTDGMLYSTACQIGDCS